MKTKYLLIFLKEAKYTNKIKYTQIKYYASK